MKRALLSTLSGIALLLGASAASAQQAPVKFGLCYDLSKAYTFVTPQIVQAAKDYAEILNAKGGLEGQQHRDHRPRPRQRAAARHRVLRKTQARRRDDF